jgi:hypothetical protein
MSEAGNAKYRFRLTFWKFDVPRVAASLTEWRIENQWLNEPEANLLRMVGNFADLVLWGSRVPD